MVINQSNLDALFISFSTMFGDAYMQTPAALTDAVATRVASNTRDQRYPFMQTISGAMRQWTGERQVNNVAIDGFVVTNVKWEDTLAIERTDLEDDQYGVYRSMLIPNLARNAKVLADQQVAAVFNNNLTCFDGRALFASNHYTDPQAKKGSQSNTSGGTFALSSTNLAKAQAAMMSFTGPDGIPLASYGDTLLVPPSLWYVASTLANAAYFPESKNGTAGTFSAQTNVFQGQFRVVVSPYLTDSGDPTTAVWYLLDTRSSSRAVMWQEREAPQLVSLVDPASPTVFFEDRYYMGARARGAASPALWFKAYRGNA